MIEYTSTACILAALGTIPALLIAFKKLKSEFSVYTLSVFIFVVFCSATFISAYFHTQHLISSIQEGEGLMRLPIPSKLFTFTLIAEGLLFDVFIFLMIRNLTTSNAWKWILGALLFALTVISIMATVISYSGHFSFEKSFFFSCCGSMGFTGAAWGLGYREICVIGNIYLQLFILLSSFIWLETVIWKRFRESGGVLNTALLISSSLYTMVALAFSIWVVCHYAMPLVAAYHLCVSELIAISRQFHITYNEVNYIIFIYGFLAVIIINLVTAKLLKPKNYL